MTLGEQLSTATTLAELGVADKGRIELQASIQATSSDLIATGSQPPPNTGRSHDPSHRMGSILCVEVDDDRGQWVWLLNYVLRQPHPFTFRW